MLIQEYHDELESIPQPQNTARVGNYGVNTIQKTGETIVLSYQQLVSATFHEFLDNFITSSQPIIILASKYFLLYATHKPNKRVIHRVSQGVSLTISGPQF